MRRMLMFGALVCALSCMGGPAYAGATSSSDLGTLQNSDLPEGFELESAPSLQPVPMTVVVDGDACSQELEPIDQLDEIAIARFRATGGNRTLMSEAVASFDSVGPAKASYKERASGAKAAIKCDGVDVVGADPPATLLYEKLKFPKIGDQSYAVTVGGISSPQRSTTIVFRSGPDVVYLNVFGFEGEPTVKQLKAIARRAEKRLD